MPSLARSRSRALHCCESLSLSCLCLMVSMMVSRREARLLRWAVAAALDLEPNNSDSSCLASSRRSFERYVTLTQDSSQRSSPSESSPSHSTSTSNGRPPRRELPSKRLRFHAQGYRIHFKLIRNTHVPHRHSTDHAARRALSLSLTSRAPRRPRVIARHASPVTAHPHGPRARPSPHAARQLVVWSCGCSRGARSSAGWVAR